MPKLVKWVRDGELGWTIPALRWGRMRRQEMSRKMTPRARLPAPQGRRSAGTRADPLACRSYLRRCAITKERQWQYQRLRGYGNSASRFPVTASKSCHPSVK